MKKYALLTLLCLTSLVSARDITIAWDPPVVTHPQIQYELVVTPLGMPSIIVKGSELTATIPVNLIPGDKMNVKIRAFLPETVTCNGSPCKPSGWATFNGLPTPDTYIIYPSTPTVNEVKVN